jgi:membrane associated rhomboid family serine protease
MLEDRDYMREPDYGQSRWRSQFRLRWTWTMALIATYVVVLIAQQIAVGFFDKNGAVSNFITEYLALSKEGLASGYVWQLFTYQFMHAGWMHLLLNSWVIFIFGNELEMLLGARRYLALMFSSGIVGGVFQVLAAMASPWFDGPVVGASAGAFGLVAAFAMLFPERELTMLIFFVIPVHLKAKMLLVLSAVLAVVGSFFPSNHIANAAHLGGMIMGCFYVKKLLNQALLGVGDEEAYFRPPPPAKPVEKPADEFQDADVDAVLDKISARGINSLTSRERSILEAARRKMAQR